MSNNFTLIAYKPDSSCISMGCEVERYSSDHRIVHCTNLQEMAKAFVEIQNIPIDKQESQYEITMLCNGVPQDEWSGNMDAELTVEIGKEVARQSEELRLKLERETQERLQQEAAEKAAAAKAQEEKEMQQFFMAADRLGYNVAKKQEA